MTVDSIKDFIKQNSAKEIYYKYLLGQDVWYFNENIKDEDPLLYYDKFKKLIALKLDVHFNNISIIGTAKTKFSFSPEKHFKEFDKQSSDFDIVIVSSELFRYFWNAFYDISKDQYVKNYSSITSNIFRKFISVKESADNYDNEALLNWQRKLTDFKTELQLHYRIFNDINYRVYENWESVESYHIQGIKKLKDSLNEAN
jgi:hypothetical protein